MCSGNCSVGGSGIQECVPALDHTKSAGVDSSGVLITLKTLETHPGYWRSVPGSAAILPCWNEDVCLGGVTNDASYCDDGHRGPCELAIADVYIRLLILHAGSIPTCTGFDVV